MDLTRTRWRVLIFSCFINLCAGSLYAWSVFASPMEQHLNSAYGAGLAAGGLAIVFTVANMVGPVTMIPGGRINDRLGPRWVVFAGGLMFGGGMFASGFATCTGFLIVSYGLGCGLGMGLIYGCNISNAVKFFPDKRGIVGGLTTASYGISSVIIPPLANAINSSVGVTASFKILGVAFMVIICGGSMFLAKCPDDFVPANWQKDAKAAATQLQKQEYDWLEMIKTPSFYLMLIMMVCGAVSGLMCISQASSIAQQMAGMTVAMAAVSVSVLALFNTGGRVAAGFVSDKIGRINTLLCGFILSAAGLILLSANGSNVLCFYIAICLIGLSFGTFMGVYPAFTADRFGQKNNSVNYGIMFIGFALAGYLGPTLMRAIYAAKGVYSTAFMTAAAFTLLGVVLLVIYKRLNRSEGS